jgi:hypothetical protein
MRLAEDGNTILQLSGGRWVPGALVNGDFTDFAGKNGDLRVI